MSKDKFKKLVRDVQEELERDPTVAKPPAEFVYNRVQASYAHVKAKIPQAAPADSLEREEAYAKLLVALVDEIRPKCRTIGPR